MRKFAPMRTFALLLLPFFALAQSHNDAKDLLNKVYEKTLGLETHPHTASPPLPRPQNPADKIEFVGKIGSKTTYDMRGDLTLRGETHPIEVRVVQMDAKSLEASFSIDRTQWSVGTGPAALVISDNVDLVAKINLN